MIAREDPPSRRSVLIVDDDRDLRDGVKEELEDHGFDVRVAGDGRAAMALLGDWRPDAILLDLNMPTLNGWEFRVRQQRDARLAAIPVVAMSGDGSPKAAAIGSDAFLEKPFRPDCLLAVVEQVLSSAEARRQAAAPLVTCDRMATLGMLAAGVVHEMNNPLAAVVANLELVGMDLSALVASSDGKLPLEELGADLDGVRAGVDRLRALVRDLQALFPRRAGGPGPVAVGQLLDSCAAIALPFIRDRARLVKDYGGGTLLAEGTESAIGQVLLNLLVNAAEAIPKGAPERNEIRMTTRMDGGRRVSIAIRDSGAGVSPEVLGGLFQPFVTTKPASIGTGLGLYVARMICGELGGALTAESEVGRGSTFTVSLPASAPH
jgi:signal transduction histidine kinase